jgi:hypothetical protein
MDYNIAPPDPDGFPQVQEFPSIPKTYTQPVYGCPPPPLGWTPPVPETPELRSVYPDVPPARIPSERQQARQAFDSALNAFLSKGFTYNRSLVGDSPDNKARDAYMKAKDAVFNAAVELWLQNQLGRTRETPGPSKS